MLPFALLLVAPVYPLAVYAQCLRAYEVQQHQFAASRAQVFRALHLALCDLGALAGFLLVQLTVYKRETVRHIQTHYRRKFDEDQAQQKPATPLGSAQERTRETLWALRLKVVNFKGYLVGILLIALDLLALPAVAFVHATYVKRRKYAQRLEEARLDLEERDLRKRRNVIKYYLKLALLRLRLAYAYLLKALLAIVIFVVLVALSALLLWRVVTLVQVLRSARLSAQVTQRADLGKYKRFQAVMRFVFVEFLWDCVYLPVLLLCALLAPHRLLASLPALTHAYLEDDRYPLRSQIALKRSLLVRRILRLAALDLLALAQLACLLLVPLRALYLQRNFVFNELSLSEFARLYVASLRLDFLRALQASFPPLTGRLSSRQSQPDSSPSVARSSARRSKNASEPLTSAED